jgi:predicted ATPase
MCWEYEAMHCIEQAHCWCRYGCTCRDSILAVTLRREVQGIWQRAQPLLLVVENLHWSDTATRGVLDSPIEDLPTAPMLLLVSYRPEYQHERGGKTYYA